MFYSYGVYVWVCPSYLLGEQSHLIYPRGNFLIQWTKRAILFLCSNLKPAEKNCHKNIVTFLPLKPCWGLGKNSQNVKKKKKKKNGDITWETVCSSPYNSQSCSDSSLWEDWEQCIVSDGKGLRGKGSMKMLYDNKELMFPLKLYYLSCVSWCFDIEKCRCPLP